MEPWLFVVAILATSAVAGAIGAILGLGGGIVLVPILTMFYGVHLRDAMGASIISVIATSSGAAAAYLRTGLSNIRIGLFLAMATVSGAIVGAGLVGLVPESVLELILGLALAYSTLVTLRQLNVEIPAEPRVDPLAMSFELEGAYYDAGLDRDVKYRAARVRTGFGATRLTGPASDSWQRTNSRAATASASAIQLHHARPAPIGPPTPRRNGVSSRASAPP